MTAFLATNRVKNALSGGNGVYNQDKFHMIFDELQKRKIKENAEANVTEQDDLTLVSKPKNTKLEICSSQMFSVNAENEKINIESEYGSSPSKDVMTDAKHLSRIKSAGDQVDSVNDKVQDLEAANSESKIGRMNLQCETETMPGSGVFFEGRNNINLQFATEAPPSSAKKLSQAIQGLNIKVSDTNEVKEEMLVGDG